MGSYSSTRWDAHTKKTTAEACLALDVNRLVKHGIGTQHMTCAFWCSGAIGSQLYFEFINLEGDTPLLILENLHDPSADHQTITFQSTAGTYGGLRWWFTCPTCKRRLGKLYLRPERTGFACRRCHELTYASAQTAHHYDRRKDEIGSIGQGVVLMKKLDRAFARVNKYQRSCKGKVKAFAQYLRVAEELNSLLSEREI